MKKIYLILFISLMLILPINIKALQGNIDKYYVDATVLANGDVNVKELIIYSGTYNGFERSIVYSQPQMEFDGSLASYEASNIYMGDSLDLIAIKSIPVDSSSDFNTIYEDGSLFTNDQYANLGDSLVYTESINNGTSSYRMYNYTSNGLTGFYIEYVIKNKAVMHNDIAELGLSIFGKEFSESIDSFEMLVHTPNNALEHRAWVHGDLNLSYDLLDKETVRVTATNYPAETLLDIRVVFDKEVIVDTLKITTGQALPKILEVEKKWSDEANAIRAKYRAIIGVYYVAIAAWFIGLIYVIYHMYNKYDKERNSTFKTKYFRDFPGEYGPEIVGYLLNRSPSSKDLSASLTNLIAKKIVAFEEIDKKNFLLKYVDKTSYVSEAEGFLLTWFFEEIGGDGQVTVEEINKSAKKNYDKFLNNYTKWRGLVKKEGSSLAFFENGSAGKVKATLYALIGIFLTVISLQFVEVSYIQMPVFIVSIASVIYFVTITKRTEVGNEQFLRWIGLKNFLKDFGKFSARDLPNVVLWEKYLVYALVFGLAGKLAKTMSIRFTEMTGDNMNGMYNINHFNRMVIINNAVSHNVNSAVSTANNARVAASRNSSSGGFGGGGSMGGGGFGGGGGGGF